MVTNYSGKLNWKVSNNLSLYCLHIIIKTVANVPTNILFSYCCIILTVYVDEYK